MSKELWKDTKFKKEIRNFIKKRKDIILDIVLFGSVVRGKEKPGDIDLLIVYKGKKNLDVGFELKKKLNTAGYAVDIIDKEYKELFEPLFSAREALLSEGYSISYGTFISEGLGYMNLSLFKYELKGFTKSQRMRFYYSLYGRGAKQGGMLHILNAVKFSDTLLLCHVSHSEKMKEYLDTWHIKFREFPIIIPDRLKSVLK